MLLIPNSNLHLYSISQDWSTLLNDSQREELRDIDVELSAQIKMSESFKPMIVGFLHIGNQWHAI